MGKATGALVLAGALALGASPAAAKAAPPTTAHELAALVAAKGQGCADFEASDPSSRLTIGGLPAGDDGSCTIDGQRSELTVYRNATDLKTVVRAAPTLGCSIGKSFGITAWRYVVGSTWTIHTPSSATTKPLAKALGATPVVIKCK